MASTWPTAKLGDVIDLFDSQRVPLNSRQRHERQGKYPYYGAQGVIDHVDGYIFDGRYILVAEDGENLNSKKLPLALFASGRFWVNNHAHILRGKEDIADDTFLLACLNNADIKPFVTGAAQPKLSQGNLRLIGIPLPPLPIPRRIAGILSAYDELIENSQRRIKILESMASALYREWFVHFRFPGHEHHPRVPSPLGEIPKGWEVTTLGRLVEIKKGKNITKDTIRDGNVPVVAGGIAPAYFHDAPNTQSPVITISASGANAGFVKLYYLDVWASDCSYIDLSATPHVFYYYLWLDYRRASVTHLQRGSAQPHVYPKDLAQLEALGVPEELLGAFMSQVAPIFGLMMRLTAKIQNLRRTRDLLLPRLLSGQIDVEAIAS